MASYIQTYNRVVTPVVCVSAFTPGLMVASSLILTGSLPASWWVWVILSLLFLLPLAFCFVLPGRLSALGESMETAASRQEDFYLSLPPGRLAFFIFLASTLSLFMELALIRWQASVFPFFSLFKNFSLLAALAGLGLGYALASRRRIPLFFAVPLIAWQVFLLTMAKWAVLGGELAIMRLDPIIERLSMGMYSIPSPLLLGSLYLTLAVCFLLTALAFMPIGQLCGRLMERAPNLKAYGINLLGSLAGTTLIVSLSLFSTPPPIWFAVGLAPLVLLQAARRRDLILQAGFFLLAMAALAWPTGDFMERVYSPYQLLEVHQGPGKAYTLVAAGHYYQRVLDLSPQTLAQAKDPQLKVSAAHYELPYRFAPRLDRVAVIGSGMGNDVAAALRSGAKHLDAIEIDPEIVALGRRLHPEQPYLDPRVKVEVNDARTLFQQKGPPYDLLVYGLLDSHTLTSHISNVRLESYVYTVEGLTRARGRLKPDGVLTLSFCVLDPKLGRKIYLMMTKAFDGRSPLCIRSKYDRSIFFIQSNKATPTWNPGPEGKDTFTDVSAQLADPALAAEESTDDWPFFYLPTRTFPWSFVPLATLLLMLTGGLVYRLNPMCLDREGLVFALLGMGFMLIETKAIAQLGLAFGNTWRVVSIAIMGVLVMIFLANWLVQQARGLGLTVPFSLLLVSLGASYWLLQGSGLRAGWLAGLWQVFLLTCPLFFAGIIFSRLLKRSTNLPTALGANLLGFMIGGMLEYLSMYFGYSFLALLAMAIYGVAFLLSLCLPRSV